MSGISAKSVAVTTTAILGVGTLAYVIYFDYMRRHSPEFRRGLKRQQKQLAAAAEAEARAATERNTQALRAVLAEIENETSPVSPEQQEVYFQEQVAQGEALAAMGPEHHVDAASHFYRALRVYPQPLELIRIYEKVVPPPVFLLFIQLTRMTEAPTTRAAPTLEEMMAMIAPQIAPSIEDLDDTPPNTSSPNADSATSGASWERVEEA